MNSKIFNFFLGAITVISGANCLLSFLLEVNNLLKLSFLESAFAKLSYFEWKYLPPFQCFAVVVLIVVIWKYKKNFANLFSLLNEMALNNKLHPIRERVMIEQDRISGIKTFRIQKAKFGYYISSAKRKKNENKCNFNVQYELDFVLKKSVFQIFSREQQFSFYVIGKGAPKKTKFVPQYLNSCVAKVIVNGMDTVVAPVIHPATLGGKSNDKTLNYAGLFKVTFPFTERISFFDTFRVNMKYSVINNISLEDDSDFGQYGFVIIPLNYTSSMKQMDVEVSASEDVILKNVELQEISSQGKTSMYSLFGESKEGSTTVFQLLDQHMKPDVKAAYFISFDYGKANRDICKGRKYRLKIEPKNYVKSSREVLTYKFLTLPVGGPHGRSTIPPQKPHGRRHGYRRGSGQAPQSVG